MNNILNAAFPIVNESGAMTQQFRDLMNRLQRNLAIVGAGSPEGVIEANQYTFYIDNTGSTGTMLYVKKLASISNDPKQGWELV